MATLTGRFPASFRTLLFMNPVWLAIYFAVFAALPHTVSDAVAFSTPDAQEYLSAGYEFHDPTLTGFSYTRPFLYPLLIRISRGAGGAWALWLMQLLFWLGAANLVFLALQRAVQRNSIAVVGSLMYASNLSAIAITLHGLTETVTALLLSALLFTIAARDPQQPVRLLHRAVLILVLLTVVKPLFYIPLLLVLAMLPFLAFGIYRQEPRRLVILALVLSPLVYQLALMKVKYNAVTVSFITGKTLRNYLLTQGLRQTGGGTWEDAMSRAQALPKDEIPAHMAEHRRMYAALLFENLQGNIEANPTYLLFPKQFAQPVLASWMKRMNRVYYFLHVLFLLPWLAALPIARRTRNQGAWLLLLAAGLMNLYILATSAISFWQGDRLVLPALPVFAVLYPFVAVLLYRALSDWRNKEEGVSANQTGLPDLQLPSHRM